MPPDPHVRFDTNDYSVDPCLVGRRVENQRSHSRRSRRWRSTPGSWLARTSAASATTARSLRWRTPGRSEIATTTPRARASRLSSSARLLSMTGWSRERHGGAHAPVPRRLRPPGRPCAAEALRACTLAEQWSYERFTEALLSAEIASRDARSRGRALVQVWPASLGAREWPELPEHKVLDRPGMYNETSRPAPCSPRRSREARRGRTRRSRSPGLRRDRRSGGEAVNVHRPRSA